MNINEIQSPKIKSTDEVYNILDNVECGPFDGGCVLIAQALKKIHGGDIVVLVNKKGIADHAAVKVGNKLIDFDGALPVKQFVKRFEKNEHTTIKSIRAIKKNDLPDAPRNKEIVPQLVNALSESKLSEGYKLKLERDTDMMVLHITDTATGKRTEVRGKSGYETGGYDSTDRLHILLDKIGKSANISDLMNGDTVGINPKHTKGASANAAATTAFNESLDNPYPFNLTGPSESQEFSAIAKTPNGVLRMDFETTDYDNFGIDFSVGKSMGKTDAGDEFRVFATVVAMMTKWIKTVGIKHVESFDFGANKDEHASDGRAKLYTRFAKQLASKLGWKLEQSTTRDNNTAFFRLVNPKPIPREQEYWDALDEGVEVSLHGDAKKGYVLSKIEVSSDERDAGQGTKAMQDIVDRMDREGAIIALTPDDAFGGNKNRLIKFYKRFGFVPNKGRNKDFRFRETMIRYPQTNESVNEVSKEEFDAIQNGYIDIEFDKKWWPLNDDYPLIKHIGNAISATSWTSWGKVGVPWSDTEMIGGGGTYMLKGDFGHILLDTAKSYRPDKIVMSQISTSKRGDGIGAKVMNAIKSYSDQNKLSLTIYKVTNQKFFDKFAWLKKTGVDTYEYSVNEVKESAGVGRVVKGVNTTVDVGVDEIINQVKKFGNDVDRDGKPKKNLRNK
jgi:GNAT superfamily N-acetyltransferase